MKAKVSDGGTYSCVAMNAAGEALRHIHLTVLGRSTPTVRPPVWPQDDGGIFLCRLVPPSIRDSGGESPLVVNTRAGTSLTLRCESSAVPPPNTTWYKNGRLVTDSANLRLLKERQMLEIPTTRVKLRSCTWPVLSEPALIPGI